MVALKNIFGTRALGQVLACSLAMGLFGCQASLVNRAERKHENRVKRNRDDRVTRLDLRGMKLRLVDGKALAGLQSVRWLVMPQGTADRHLEAVAQMSSLESLSLFRSSVTDQGVSRLKILKRLRHLNLVGTKVSEAAIKDLRQANPDLNVYR